MAIMAKRLGEYIASAWMNKSVLIAFLITLAYAVAVIVGDPRMAMQESLNWPQVTVQLLLLFFLLLLGLNLMQHSLEKQWMTEAPHLRAPPHTDQGEAKLEYFKEYDPITGLPNRHAFRSLFEELLRRESRGMGLFLLDLDRFKTVNESLGHVAGDLLLRQVGERLQKVAGAKTQIARLGDDEFALLAPGLKDSEEAVAFAQDMLAALSPYFTLERQHLFMRASIGISIFPQHGGDATTLLKHADAALHSAKAGGRGRYQFYTPEMGEQMAENLALEGELHWALERQEFMLYYQPLIEIDSGRVVGMEALLRWRRQNGEIVPPGRFIPILEETGLIISVGQWVLRAACRQNRAWQVAGLPRIRVSVNISTLQFGERLVEQVATILKECGLEPECLELEITESMLMQNPEAAIETLNALRRMGLRVAIDDFGTDYSSLSYLKRLPIDGLKVDRSFIQELPDDSGSAAIVSAVIALGQKLNIPVVAEGVETESQLSFLREQGYQLAQGYLFGHPEPAEQATARLRRG